jgi:hypothetical protein
LPLRETKIRTIDTQGLNDSARLLSTPFDAKSLDHKHREATLGRWLLPVPRQARTESLKEDIENGEDLDSAKTVATRKDLVAAIVERFRQLATEEVTTAKKLDSWEAQPQLSLSATFGQALFPLDETESSSTTESWTDASSQPIFTPSVPGMTTLFSSAQAQKSSTSGAFQFDPLPHQPVLLYEFIPAPEQQRLSEGQTLPGLRIEMRTGATGTEAKFHKLYIFIHEHLHTVLLPEEAVDLQLQRVLRVAMRDDHSVKAIDEWVGAVAANIASGERVSAPNLTIDIPKWTITGQPDNAEGVQAAKYLFSGVRFRQSVAGSFRGMAVSYKTNQSSKMAPQGGSLSMHYKHSKRNVQAPAEGVDRVAQFFDKCFMFAKRITQAASNTQPVAKLDRTNINERSQKPKRQEEAAAKKEEENVVVGSEIINATFATADNFVVNSISDNESTATVNIAEDAIKQHQEEVRSMDEASALKTETIEMKADNNIVTGENGILPSPAKDDGAVDRSEDVPPPKDDAETRRQNSVPKAQT